jgi:hypothetical protein
VRTKIAEAVTVEQSMIVEVRPDLYASKCDACERVFEMEPFCNDRNLATLHGTFETPSQVVDSDNRGLGNMFNATVCSFKCAHTLFAEGGWKKMKEYKPFVDADARLARAEVCVTVYVKEQEEILREWKGIEQCKPLGPVGSQKKERSAR